MGNPDAHYDEFGSCHNIVINEDTGFAYGVGSRTCRGGPHIIDIHDPLNPKYVGCYADDGYTHDAQCVIYNGTQTKYVGREICYCYNEDSLTIIDVDDKDSIEELTRIWDVRDLTKPYVMESYYSPEKSVDHNMYVIGDLVYQANYESGLRILDCSNIADKELSEVGYFDCRPEGTQIAFNGAWSVYPYFESGNVIVSSIERGLFVLKYNA